VRKSPLSTHRAPNSYEHVTSFNNFYEFASGAGDGPKKLSGRFRPSPWTIAVEGNVAKPASYALEDFIKPHVSKSASIDSAVSSVVLWCPVDRDSARRRDQAS
jgi:DMSO/TMAO reductase YedYZ molybdopterin-dependent catalytic subunit